MCSAPVEWLLKETLDRWPGSGRDFSGQQKLPKYRDIQIDGDQRLRGCLLLRNRRSTYEGAFMLVFLLHDASDEKPRQPMLGSGIVIVQHANGAMIYSTASRVSRRITGITCVASNSITRATVA
jgi:hypothetical protein